MRGKHYNTAYRSELDMGSFRVRVGRVNYQASGSFFEPSITIFTNTWLTEKKLRRN